MRNLTGLTIGQANILMSASIIAVDLLARGKNRLWYGGQYDAAGPVYRLDSGPEAAAVASGLADGLLSWVSACCWSR
jgi:hypothetical protein